MYNCYIVDFYELNNKNHYSFEFFPISKIESEIKNAIIRKGLNERTSNLGIRISGPMNNVDAACAVRYLRAKYTPEMDPKSTASDSMQIIINDFRSYKDYQNEILQEKGNINKLIKLAHEKFQVTEASFKTYITLINLIENIDCIEKTINSNRCTVIEQDNILWIKCPITRYTQNLTDEDFIKLIDNDNVSKYYIYFNRTYDERKVANDFLYVDGKMYRCGATISLLLEYFAASKLGQIGMYDRNSLCTHEQTIRKIKGIVESTNYSIFDF